jgi:hypothetical protein
VEICTEVFVEDVLFVDHFLQPGQLLSEIEAGELLASAKLREFGGCLSQEGLQIGDFSLADLYLLFFGPFEEDFLGSDSQTLLILFIDLSLMCDLLPELFDVIIEVLNLSSQLADVLIDEVILLFVLEKGRGDLLEIVDTAFFFDFLETFPDGFHRLAIGVDHFDPFLVSGQQMAKPISHKRQSVCAFIFLFHFAPAFEDLVAGLAVSKIFLGAADFFAEGAYFSVVLNLDGDDALFVFIDGGFAADDAGLFLLDELGNVVDGVCDLGHDFSLSEFFLAEFVDFCLEFLVGGEDGVIGVDALVQFVLQDLDLSLHFVGFRAELLTAK